MAASLLALALLASPAAASDAWLSLRGSGFFTQPDTRTLPARRFSLALGLDNRDRDPLGLDLLDGSLAFTLGLAPRLEAYGHAVLSRVAALPERPALPPPPLDLILAPGAEAPSRPYYALYAETPYVNKRGSARFDDWVRGDALLGLKRRVSDGAGWAPALAVAAELKLPLSRRLVDLQSGSGTGGIDLGARLIGEWQRGADTWLAAAAFVRTGAPALGDRVITALGNGAPLVTDAPLSLADRVELGFGWRHRLAPGLALTIEGVKVVEAGSRSAVLDATPPLDLLAGLQARWGRSRLAAGLRYHADALRSGSLRSAPHAGLVDVTDVAEADLALYLAELGASGALQVLREGSQRLVAPGARAPLPAGARPLPDSYRVRSEHQIGFVLVWGWAF